MKNFFIKLLTGLGVLAMVFAVHAQTMDDLNFDILIEQYLQGLAKQLPPGQQDQIDVYRKYLKDTVNSIIPPEVLKRQFEAAQEIFPQTPASGAGQSTKPQPFSTSDQSLTLSAEPVSPAPKTSVTVKAEFNLGSGFSFPDVQKGATTQFNWYLDNVLMRQMSGTGQNTITFTAGVLGTVHSVRLQARLSTGKTVNAALLVPVVDADISWFTDTYTPPGYRGKPLATMQSPIVAVAQPFIPPSFGLLNYIWTIDDDTPLSGFGINKNTVLIGFPQETHTVSVQITDLNGNIDITKEISVRRAVPKILFHKIRANRYDRDAKAYINFQLSPADAFSVSALPYYFNVRTLNGLRFIWTVDGGSLPEAVKNPDVFTLNIAQARLKPGTEVQKTLGLQVQNKDPNYDEFEQFMVPMTIR